MGRLVVKAIYKVALLFLLHYTAKKGFALIS